MQAVLCGFVQDNTMTFHRKIKTKSTSNQLCQKVRLPQAWVAARSVRQKGKHLKGRTPDFG